MDISDHMPESLADVSVGERQETEVNLCLAGAQLSMGQGDYRRAEKLFRRAAKWGSQRWGRYSANVGNILLELQELYELQGLETEARHVDSEIKAILRRYFFDVVREANLRKRS